MGAGDRASTTRNASNAHTPVSADSATNAPPRGHSISAKVTAPSPTVARTAPGQSNFLVADSLRLSGTPNSVIHTTNAASGRLIKKTHLHEACSTIQPPRTGPSAAVIAVKPDHVPMARPRSASGNEALMSARLPGTSNAAPAP